MKLAATFLTLLTAVPFVFAGGDCGDTIYDIAKGDGRFDTLQAALELTGLDEVLDKDGPFTVFAPTDKAFKKLHDDTLDALLANADALTDILLYHVVEGETFSKDLEDGDKIKTLVGRKVKVDIDHGDIEINNANVIKADIKACNGVIHVIDKVLIPELKYVGECTRDKKCGFCEGDCDGDKDCKDGRHCVKRDKGKFDTVPFCKGGDDDSDGKDYCSYN